MTVSHCLPAISIVQYYPSTTLKSNISSYGDQIETPLVIYDHTRSVPVFSQALGPIGPRLSRPNRSGWVHRVLCPTLTRVCRNGITSLYPSSPWRSALADRGHHQLGRTRKTCPDVTADLGSKEVPKT